MGEREVMPIMKGVFLKAVPWAIISAHEEQAQRNHSQTLNRLAERGGLIPSEAVAIIKNEPWTSKTSSQIEKKCEASLMGLTAIHLIAREE